MNESNLSDVALAELLTLTIEVTRNGTIIYRNHLGQAHRIHGPARIHFNGDRIWYKNGKHHREDGPAMIYHDGDLVWAINGKYHRVGGPAIEYADGGGAWWLNGIRHRADGPAVMGVGDNGYREWWLNGQRLTEREYNERVKSV